MAKKAMNDEEDDETAPRSNKGSAKDSQAKKKGSHAWKFVLIALLVIVVILVILFILYGSLPGALIAAALSGTPLTGHNIEGIILQKIASTPALGATYTGTILLNGQDPNITITYIKYGPETRISYDINNISFIGNGVITVISSTSNAYQDEICIPASLALFSGSSVPANATYYCANQNSTNYAALVTKVNSLFNISGASGIHINSYGIGLYNLQPCYKVAGTGTMTFNRELIKETGDTPASINFTACVSAQYDIPITLSGSIRFADQSGSNDTMAFNLTQQSMNTSVTSADVNQLPT